jgi:epsin
MWVRTVSSHPNIGISLPNDIKVRVSAKELTALILDEERLKAERRDRKSWKSRVSGLNDQDPDIPAKPKKRENRTQNPDEDLEYRLAIEASKNEAEEAARRRATKSGGNEVDDDDLAKAIKLSKEEEELRRKELEEANANSLFSEATPQASAVQPTGWNQGYQQQPTVDWFGNVIDQQPQNTGYPGAYQNGFGYPTTAQPQMTGYNANFMQPQQTAFNNNNPYGQGQNAFGSFGQQPQQQQQQAQDPGLQPGSNNPWALNNSSLQDNKPLPTGSNNPFASPFSRPQPQTQMQPTLSSLQEQNAAQAFNPILNYTTPTTSIQPSQPTPQPAIQPSQPAKPLDPHHARLNALLASGDGLDTFGNVGELRVPAQHTAPGTFVNSSGAHLNRLTQNNTANPFLNSQFTGMPQQRIPPAQTGPAGAYGGGYGGNNPFGASHQPQSQQQNGNLIDL